MKCGRYKLEMRRNSDNPMSLKEINRRKESDEKHLANLHFVLNKMRAF